MSTLQESNRKLNILAGRTMMLDRTRMVGVMIMLLFLIHFASGDFLAENLADPFILRAGGATCPRFMEFTSLELPPKASSITVEDRGCTSGVLSLNSTGRNRFVEYMQDTQGAGTVLSMYVTREIVCEGLMIDARGVLNFVRPEKDIELLWAQVYGTNWTGLETDTGKSYTMKGNRDYMVINELCLFTKHTAEEIEAQIGECFSERATVRTKMGSKRVAGVKTGDMVWDGDGFVRVIGVTHADGKHIGKFMRLETREGELIISQGHFLYAEEDIRAARDVKVGMKVRTVRGWEQVLKVEIVLAAGLYDVQTESGLVAVDGFVCTTYTEAVAPAMAHALLAPVRVAARMGIDLLRWYSL